MTSKEYKDKRGRRALTSAIMSTRFLSSISSIWKTEGMFLSSWENLIAGWCVNYHKEYGKAPRKNIQGIFQNWEQRTEDQDTAEIVQKFLSSLSDDFEETNGKINSKYEIEQAKPYFLENEAKLLIQKLQGAIDTKSHVNIEQHIRDFRAPNLGADSDDIHLFNDLKSWECMFDEKEDVLIKYPGPLGEFFGRQLARGNFISLLGPEKRGKTYILMDIAYRAMLNRRRVAFFEVGDMTREQISRRFAVRMCNNPWRPKLVKEPYRMSADKNGTHVDFREVEYKDYLQLKMLEESSKRLADVVKSSKTLFKLRVYPASSLSVSHLRNVVEGWIRDDWVPDAIVIDYADLLAQSWGKADVREKTNEIWVGLRALSQTGPQPLVVTATQANRASYNIKTINMEHTSEDKRKVAHVTGMIGLNCTKEEKRDGVLRLNWLALREDDYHPEHCVHVAGCLSLANPTMLSCFERPMIKKDE